MAKLDYLSEFVAETLRGIREGMEKAKEAGIPAQPRRTVWFEVEAGGYKAEFAVEMEGGSDELEERLNAWREDANSGMQSEYSVPYVDNVSVSVTCGTARIEPSTVTASAKQRELSLTQAQELAHRALASAEERMQREIEALSGTA